MARPSDGGVPWEGGNLKEGERLVKCFRAWAKKLQMDPRNELVIKLVDAKHNPEDRVKWWYMSVESEQAEYRRWWVEIATGWVSAGLPMLESCVIHELLHVLLYRYTWLAEQLDTGHEQDSPLAEVEETIVSDLVAAICNVAGVDDGTRGG